MTPHSMRGRADRLFHTVVVLGASLHGCAGRAVENHGSSAEQGGAPSAGGAPTAAAGAGGKQLTPADCTAPADFTCNDYGALTGCVCNAAAPKTRADCADPFAFQCHELTISPTPNGGIELPQTLYVGCECVSAPLRPDACATPEAFFCARLEPDFADCTCNSARVCSDVGDQCCQSLSPRFGCDCCPVPIR